MKFTCIFLWLLITGRIDSLKNLAQVCIKSDVSSYGTPLIKIPACGFKDLVKHSDVFVDKSSLIKPILEAGSVVSITYPRKWGKTINLDMLKVFLELEVDSEGKAIPRNATWSYKYFKHGIVEHDDGKSVKLTNPPLISKQEKVIERFLGKYPIIYLDLSTFHPESGNLTAFYTAFRKSIAEVYKKFDYLVDLWREKMTSTSLSDGKKKAMKKMIDTFKAYRSEEVDDVEGMIKSLKSLGEILFKRFRKRVYVFIDNYDNVIWKGYVDYLHKLEATDWDTFLNFYVKFLKSTFESNTNVVGGVVTGVLSIEQCLIDSGFDGVVDLRVMNKSTPYFFGFSNFEVTQLFGLFHIPERLVEEARTWYCGFTLDDFPEMVYCNPWSIVNFANTRKFERFWGNVEKFQINENSLKNFVYVDGTKHFLTRSPHTGINFNSSSFSLNDTKSLLTKYQVEKNLFYKLFCAAGYFSSSIDSRWGTHSILKIPCKEIDETIMEATINYYEGKFGDNARRLIKKAADRFIQFIEYSDFHSKNLVVLMDNLRDLFRLCVENASPESWITDGGWYYEERKKELEKEAINEAHFLILLYVRLRSSFSIVYKPSCFNEKCEEREIQAAICGRDNGLVYDYSLLREIHKISEKWNRANDLLQIKNYFDDKNVKLIRFMLVVYNDENNTIGVLMKNERFPCVLSLESDGGCKESGWWSFGCDQVKSWESVSSESYRGRYFW